MIMNNDSFKDKNTVVNGWNTYDIMKHIAPSNNQITYSSFEIKSKVDNIANEIMKIRKDITLIKGLLLGKSKV